MEKVSDFKINLAESIGRGTFGEVFIAEDKSGKKVVAKRIAKSPVILQDIHAEIKSVKTIKEHENIVGYINSHIAGNVLWIFSGYCEEGDLNQYCAKFKLELVHKLDICHQCACAIEYLHRLSPHIAHGNIKPSNILMGYTLDAVKVKLADVGLNKTRKDPNTLFMAPEQFSSDAVKDNSGKASDIFALGLVYFALKDSVPGKTLRSVQVNGKPMGQVMNTLNNGLFPVWTPVTSKLDDDSIITQWNAIISSMIYFEVENRPRAQKVKDRLKSLIDSFPSEKSLPKTIRAENKAATSQPNGESNSGNNAAISRQNRESNSGNNAARSKPNSESNSEANAARSKPNSESNSGNNTAQSETNSESNSGDTARQNAEVVRSSNVSKSYASKTKSYRLYETIHLGSKSGFSSPTHKIVVVGGNVESGVSECCWVLDTPDDGFFWKVFDEIPKSVKAQLAVYSVCAIDDNSFVIVGGGNDKQSGAVCFIYSVQKKKWKTMSNVKTPRCNAGIVCFQKVLYLVGGKGNKDNVLSSCEKLDKNKMGVLQHWKQCKDMLQAMVFPLLAAAGDGIYVVLNTHRDNQVNMGAQITLQHYNPKLKVWQHRAALPESCKKTYGASVIGDGGYVYLMGGLDKLSLSYNVSKDDWTILKPCPSVHSFAAICCAGGKISILGGRDEAGHKSPKVEEYNIKTNEWRIRALEMPEPIMQHNAFVPRM